MNTVLRRYRVAAALLVLMSAAGACWSASPPPVATAAADCENLGGDAAIAAAIRTRLSASATIEAADIEVRVRDGQVGLRGQARSRTQKSSAAELAGDTRGVLGVVDQLDLVDWVPITDIAQAQARSRATERERATVQTDAWISAAIVHALRTSRSVGSCDVAVATRDGVATLNGVVGSNAARDRAVALAGDTLGVRQVDAARLTVR